MNAIDRRRFLATSGTLAVAFTLQPAAAFADGPPAHKTVAANQVDGFLEIDGQGRVTLFSGKVDLGTGVRTALTQIVAEELDVPMDIVTVLQGDTALTPDQGTSSGSQSIQSGGVQIRQAAATARAALLQHASEVLGAPPAELAVSKGIVTAKSGQSVSYATLIGGKLFSLKLDPKAPLKKPADYTIVGTSAVRLDIPPKVFGTFTYMQDFKLPGMVHGRAVRPPAIGATLKDVDETSIANLPGIVKVVRDGNFLGVVAETEWVAIKASRQLKADWTAWAGLPDEDKLWDHVRATKIVKQETTSSVGDAVAALASGAKRLKASYDFAIHTHGSIGPSCAVASFENGALTCWSASQATHNLVRQLAAMLTMPVDKIRCIYIDGSGCYGRNGHEDAAADAVMLSKAVGRPVRVQWMREDEHGWDPKGPPTLLDLDAALDAKGDITAWSSNLFIPQQGSERTVALVAAGLADKPHETTYAPGGITGNSAIQYTIPNIHTIATRLETTPFKPSWIRTPGRLQNTFANESFFDELTVAAGADPFEFRRRLLKDPRALEVLERLAKLAAWVPGDDKRDHSGSKVTGRGMSYVKYEMVRTYVGGVADVEVDKVTGAIRVTHFYVVQDCGQIINPDGIKNQLEGNVIQTISRTLKEQVRFDRSRITSVDWASYPILTFPEVPVIAMDLIDRPTEAPWGAGEPSASIVPAAISNAVYNATGARMRSVPFLPDKVKAALQRT